MLPLNVEESGVPTRFTFDDLVDVFSKTLLKDLHSFRKTDILRRNFLSDYEIRKIYKEGEKILRLPQNSIISPLSMEWIALKKIKVIFE